MKRIVIVHPRGDILYNPNLLGMVEILCEQGYRVDIYSLRKNFYQKNPCRNARLIIHDDLPLTNPYIRIARKLSSYRTLRWIQETTHRMNCLYKYVGADLVIGVDADGMMEAARIAEARNIPCGFISYEILFGGEVGKAIKETEKKDCRDIVFAVCQDPLRSGCLAAENDIPQDKIISIPVAGRGVNCGGKTFYLHDRLGIAKDKHIVLYLGSVFPFTNLPCLLEAAKKWSDEWVLVVHPRCRKDAVEYPRYLQPLMDEYKNARNVFFSLDLAVSCKDLSEIIRSADLGIALYRTIPGNIWVMNNIKYLGLASGKIALFLQHGVPVVVNDIGLYSDFIKKYRLGFVVDENRIELPSFKDLEGYQARCYEFFDQKLDLDKNISPLLEKIRQLI